MIGSMIFWNVLVLIIFFFLVLFFSREGERFERAVNLTLLAFIVCAVWWGIFSALLLALKVAD